jgi:hypothetical protein
MFLTIPFDILFEISEFSSNKESFYIAISCKSMYQYFKKNKGFAKYLSYNHNSCNNNITCFIENACTHYNSLKIISITNLKDFNLWMPIWTHTIYINGGSISDKMINPSKKTHTTKLYIHGNHYNKPVKIILDKFPILKTFHYNGIISNYDDLINSKNIVDLNFYYVSSFDKKKYNFIRINNNSQNRISI